MRNLFGRIFSSGKNVVFTYYVKSVVGNIFPKLYFSRRIKNEIKNIDERSDYDYIIDRVNYYNKLSGNRDLSQSKISLKDFQLYKNKKMGSRYFFDTYEHTRCFSDDFSLDHLFGDITYVPETPKITKSRPISGNNECSIILNLDKLRHFVFLKDTIAFRQKEVKAIFLSYIKDKPQRIDFMRKFHNTSFCICGDVEKHSGVYPWENEQWCHDKISLWEHLKYKFILAIEGNDVASNLKWIMSSNSIAIMPKPKYETWFMEGKLIANYHYIEIKDDYSDFEQKVKYYSEHIKESEEIIRNANEYINQFRDKKRERIISHLVLEKYFDRTKSNNCKKAE